MHKLVSTITLTSLLVACSGAGTASPGDAAGDSAESAGDNIAEQAISAPAAIAISTVAKETGAPAEQISIRSEEAVQFSDSSLGCPRPDMAYLQVITPGYKVLAEYGGKVYDVRVSGNRGLICDRQAISGKTR
jgi:hypothetical protein